MNAKSSLFSLPQGVCSITWHFPNQLHPRIKVNNDFAARFWTSSLVRQSCKKSLNPTPVLYFKPNSRQAWFYSSLYPPPFSPFLSTQTLRLFHQLYFHNKAWHLRFQDNSCSWIFQLRYANPFAVLACGSSSAAHQRKQSKRRTKPPPLNQPWDTTPHHWKWTR